MKPIRSRRRRLKAEPDRAVMSRPSTSTRPAVARSKTADYIQQGALSGTGRAGHDGKLAGVQDQVHAPQGRDGQISLFVLLGHAGTF